jgi:hypothetical protein
MPMDAILYIIAGPLFIVSVAGYIFVKRRLRPKEGSDLDDYYHEFEDQHPEYAAYLKWSKITFTAVIISMLLLLIAIVI